MLFRALQWVVYLAGRGRRRAWCELTGGHNYQFNATFANKDAGDTRASSIQMTCLRCGHTGPWQRVPTK